MNVLLIEDESRVSEFIDRGLRAEGHGVTHAANGQDGLELGSNADFDVIIVDLMLPDIHGYDVCQRLRHNRVLTPILILSALDRPDDRVRGLRFGADDYLTKPFDFEELLARLEALVRRAKNFPSEESKLKIGGLAFDRDLLEVRLNERRIELTAKELALLELLMSSPGKVFSRTRILNNVWGYSEDPLTNVVDVYIARLRKKFDCNRKQRLIETVRGRGYRMHVD
jgi:DNA-binding response OmpR family regulator